VYFFVFSQSYKTEVQLMERNVYLLVKKTREKKNIKGLRLLLHGLHFGMLMHHWT